MKQNGMSKSRRDFVATSAAGLASTVVASSVPRTAFAADPIKFGVLAPVTDFTGKDVLRAVELGVEQVNAAGGILGRKVEIVVGDEEGTPEKAIQAYQNLAMRSKVDAIIGGFRSGSVLALQPYVSRFKVPFLITGAASPDIMTPVADKYEQLKYMFRPWVNAKMQAEFLAMACRDVLKPAGYTRLAIDAENFKWAHDYADVLKGLLPEYGFQVVLNTSHDPATTDFTPVFREAVGAKAQGLLMIISNQAGYTFVKQWRDQKVPLQIMGNNNASYLVSNFWKDTQGACEYEISTVCKAPLTDRTIPFWDAFEKKYGAAPFVTALGSYDSVFMLKQVIEQTKSTKADDIVKALEGIEYKGTLGNIKFTKSHEVEHGPGKVSLPYGQWQGGQKVALWPTPIALGKYARPPWMA
jgi:branched-chain amino acid transport system substrate-binding protein